MKNSKFVNEGGIQGAGTGFVDTKSPEWDAFLSVIQQHSKNRSNEEHTDTKLSELRFRMGNYLRGGESQLPIDIPSLLNEAIGVLGVKKKDFAAYIGIEDSNLSAMLKGNRRISPEFALKLEQIFTISATLWLSVQIKNELKALRYSHLKQNMALSRHELMIKVASVKSATSIKSIKHEPTRKTTDR
jgi:addiction module HigA family antidote